MPDLFLPGPFMARRRRGPPANPLVAFYGTGAGEISLHLSTAGVSPAGGPATAIANAGGAGSDLDAAVSGAAMALDGPWLTTGAAMGFPVLAAPVDLFSGRLLWVMSAVGAVNLTRFMGHTGSEIRANITAGGVTLQLWSNETGSGVTVNPGGRVTAEDRVYLCEVEISGGSARFFMDGTALGTAAVAWSEFPISRIGRGTGTATPLEGGMGDVIFINSGGGFDTALAAVRSYLDGRFELGLSP